jgi:chemotaxis protein histidine kinase CheA
MATLRDYFISESHDVLTQIDATLNRLDTSGGDPQELARLARTLRGSAHLARETRVYRAGLGLEAAARAVGSGQLTWDGDVSGRTRRTVEDLYALVHGAESDDEAEARVRRVIDRWQEVNVDLPSIGMQVGPSAGERSLASRQFREFAAHEVTGIAAEIEAGLAQLSLDPRNHDALKMMLRRQRALLGAARLDELKVVAEALRAIEDLVRLIVKLNAPVKDEWFNAFRAAREVLGGALDPLRRGQDPQPSPSLSTLRTLRSELIDRYGEGEAVSVNADAATYAPPPPVNTTPVATALAAAAPVSPVKPADGEVVPIEELCYRGERALRRALELRSHLETLAGSDANARENVEELFDLIRLGIG